jgi:hypothetical protein
MLPGATIKETGARAALAATRRTAEEAKAAFYERDRERHPA